MGTELVTDPSFLASGSWTQGGGWSVSSGYAKCDGSQAAASDIQQAIVCTPNQTYRTYLTVTSRGAGSIALHLDGMPGISHISTDTFTQYLKAVGSGDALELRADSAFVGALGSVYVQLAFNVTPDWAFPVKAPVFNTFESPAESMKKDYQNIGGAGVETYKLKWAQMSSEDFWILYNHYYLCYGSFNGFWWNTVPDEIDTNQSGSPDGTRMAGHWVQDSFIFKPKGPFNYEAEIVFRKDM